MEQDKKTFNTKVLILIVLALVLGALVMYFLISKNYSNKDSLGVDTNLSFEESDLTQVNTNDDSLSIVPDGQMANIVYQGSRFNFSYPKDYILTENNGGIMITSVPPRKVDMAQCEKLEDEQARATCKNPTSGMSPVISINFVKGNPNDLWKKEIIGDDNSILQVSSDYAYKYNYFGGEFGGRGIYGLFLADGLLLAKYTHEDMEGGVQFNYLKSNEYKLDRHQQKELLENILKTLKIN